MFFSHLKKPQGPSSEVMFYNVACVLLLLTPQFLPIPTFRLWRVLKCTLRDVIPLFTPGYKS